MARRIVWQAALCGSLIAAALAGAAQNQVTRADYDRALGLQEKYRDLVDHAPDAPNWIEGSDHFIYRRSTVAAAGREPGAEYV
ncbi:MAG: hypothetical protein WBE76_02135, partial [Terracidiphilus sp.]